MLGRRQRTTQCICNPVGSHVFGYPCNATVGVDWCLIASIYPYKTEKLNRTTCLESSCARLNIVPYPPDSMIYTCFTKIYPISQRQELHVTWRQWLRCYRRVVGCRGSRYPGDEKSKYETSRAGNTTLCRLDARANIRGEFSGTICHTVVILESHGCTSGSSAALIRSFLIDEPSLTWVCNRFAMPSGLTFYFLHQPQIISEYLPSYTVCDCPDTVPLVVPHIRQLR
jgi:hypothetical protein